MCLFRGDGITGVTHRRIHISWWVAVGVCQHGDNANHDCLYRVDRKPALLRLLITKLIFSWLVQNWDADVSVLCNCEERGKDLMTALIQIKLQCVDHKKNSKFHLFAQTNWWTNYEDLKNVNIKINVLGMFTIWVPDFRDELHLWRP